MKRRQIITNVQGGNRAWLYSVVYASKLSVAVVFMLFLCFFIQPFNQALAAEPIEDEEISEPVPAESVKEQLLEQEDMSLVIHEDTLELEGEISLRDETEETESHQDISNQEVLDTVIDTSMSDGSVDVQVGDEATTTDIVVEIDSDNTTATSSDTETKNSNDSQDDSATDSDNDSLENDSNDTISTTTQETVTDEEGGEIVNEEVTATSTVDEPATVQAEVLVSDENFYQFSRQSCVQVGDGTYHCTSNEVTEFDNQSVVYSELGDNGNLEIFLRTSEGITHQITDNEYDDASPYYDAKTLQVVWHRLIEGRYQVILYDIEEDEESQLTFSRTNNMEPKVSEDGVVWQAWDNNDWEIMFFDGRFTDQITDNNSQDIAPVIQDRYILWTVIGRGEQEGKVYSLDSEELLTISGYDGGVIENPRFVLVYDTKFDNGDIITQGFDPATGISEPIAAKPAPTPVDIPESDPIGEIRALIQNKSTLEEELDSQLIHSSDGISSTTPTADDTLNLKDDTTQVTATTTSFDTEFELTEFDLILTETNIDFGTLVDEEIDEIDDLIIEEIENTQ